MSASASIHRFGIRHHGPGSSRSLIDGLTKLNPDCILIEGPPEGNDLIRLAGEEEMTPPVALLIYSPDNPRKAVYYPFASFSPEWQAIQFALTNKITARFFDLPQSNWLAMKTEDSAEEVLVDSDEHPEPVELGLDEGGEAPSVIREDPLNWLARAAGYADGERWWEHVVELRQDSADVFQAIEEAMSTLRAEITDATERTDLIREAYMRQMIRGAQKEGFNRIAIVCGAWHAPALAQLPSAKADQDLLKGLPKVKVEATWIPWTHGRLSYASGYGAGVNSPGWYHHLWTCKDHVAERWMSHVARLLRAEDLDASSAHVIESVRLAEALASLRGRPLAGLDELTEATRAVFCFGSDVPLRLVKEKLIVGEVLGSVPQDTPTVPLQKDLQAEQKRLRLAPDAVAKQYDLDLRKENDLARSRLLHRLRLLGIPWGETETVRGKSGTFHELWHVKWQPEFSVSIIERAVWGRSLVEAATSFACDKAQHATELAQLTKLLQQTLLSDLETATQFVMRRVADVSAVASDVMHLMEALPPLAQISRYGDVRKTDLASITHVLDGMVTRICIGLPPACGSLADDAASEIFDSMHRVHSAILLLQNEAHLGQWRDTLLKLAETDNLHGLIAGRACRSLLEMKVLDVDESARRFGLALSSTNEPKHAADWIEGFLYGSGLLLIHNVSLWTVLDRWVTTLSSDQFTLILPLLRRTFSKFAKPERRQMGERASQGARIGKAMTQPGIEDIDSERAALVLPVVSLILGLNENESDDV